jgi:hypothetical protein
MKISKPIPFTAPPPHSRILIGPLGQAMIALQPQQMCVIEEPPRRVASDALRLAKKLGITITTRKMKDGTLNIYRLK